MNNVIITADSTADLDILFDKYGIDVTPLGVVLGNKMGLDGIEIKPCDIYEYFEKTNTTPKTSAVSPEEYLEFFKKKRLEGSEIIHFTISQSMSLCYENAVKSAKEVGGVRVIDSMSLSTGIGLQVLYAKKLADSGLSASEIEEKVLSRRDRVQASFVVETMKFLHKGGRCSGISAFVATVLNIKPSILVTNGKMDVGKKYKGKASKAIANYTSDILRKYTSIDTSCIFITHTSASDEIVKATKNEILKMYPNANVISTIAGSTVTSHCGKGTLGILFYY